MSGGLEVQSIRKLNQLARGEVRVLYPILCPVFAHKTALYIYICCAGRLLPVLQHGGGRPHHAGHLPLPDPVPDLGNTRAAPTGIAANSNICYRAASPVLLCCRSCCYVLYRYCYIYSAIIFIVNSPAVVDTNHFTPPDLHRLFVRLKSEMPRKEAATISLLSPTVSRLC